MECVENQRVFRTPQGHFLMLPYNKAHSCLGRPLCTAELYLKFNFFASTFTLPSTPMMKTSKIDGVTRPVRHYFPEMYSEIFANGAEIRKKMAPPNLMLFLPQIISHTPNRWHNVFSILHCRLRSASL